jgi:hypothetical protein
MATYPPPNFLEPLPIFNPINWEVQVSSNISIAYLDANYLKFPVAQGLETFSDTITNNDAEFAGNITMTGTSLVNYIEFPDGTQQFTAGGGGGGASLTANQTFTGVNTFSTGYINLTDLASIPATLSGSSQYLSIGNIPYFSASSGTTGVELLTQFTLTSGTGIYTSGLNSTQWTINTSAGTLIGDYGRGFNFNIIAGVGTNQTYSGSSPISSNNSLSITSGVATKQSFTISGVAGFAYLFTPISTTGSTAPMRFVSTASLVGGIIATGFYTFTLTGNYNTAPITIYGVSI